MLGGALGIGLGWILNQWFPTIYCPPILYFSAGALSIWLGILSFIFKHVRNRLADYAFLVYLFAYLALIVLAYLNQLRSSFVTLLIAGQILFAVSFRNFLEYLVFAISTLIFFTVSSLSVDQLHIPPYLFLALITVVTIFAGVYVWLRESSFQRIRTSGKMLGDLLDSSIYAIFLLDQECKDIRYQNSLAKLSLENWIGKPTIETAELFQLLGTAPTFVIQRFQQGGEDLQEKSYFSLRDQKGDDREIELIFSKINTLGEDNILIKIRDITEQRQQDRTLKRSLAFNSSLINAIPDLILTISQKGVIQTVKTGQNFPSGLPLREFVGTHFSQLARQVMSATKQKEAEENLAGVFEEGQSSEMEFLSIWQENHHYYDLRMVPLEDAQEAMVIIRDISETKAVEMALKMSEQNYREIFNSGTDGIIILHAETREILDINQLALAFLHWEDKPLKDLDLSQVWLDRSPPTWKRFIDDAVAGKLYSFEGTSQGEDEQEYWLEVTAKLAILGGEFRLVLVMRNREERKEFLQRLQSQAMLVENVSEAIISTSVHFQVTNWNPGAETLYGWKREEVIGKDLFELMNFNGGQPSREELVSLLDSKGFWRGEMVHEDREGVKVKVQTSASVIKQKGQIQTIIFLNRDTTAEELRVAQLRKSEHKFKNLFNGAPESIIVLDLEGNILDANVAALELLGQSDEGLKQAKLTSLAPPLQREALAGAYAAMTMNQLHYLESFFQHQSGEAIPVEIRANRFEVAGKPAIILHISDISERRKSAARLKFFRKMINQSRDAIFVLDATTGKVVDENEQMLISLGYSADELAELHMMDFSLEMDHQPIKPEKLFELQDLGSSIYVGRHQRKDGKTFPVEVNMSYVEVNQKQYLIGVARDINERIRQEEALRQSEMRYRTLIEKMNEGLVLTDNEERILFVNSRLCEILGMDKESLIGQYSYDILITKEHRDTLKEKTALRQQGISDQYELRLKRKSGDNLWVMVAGAPYVDSHGDIIGTIAIITDITDRKATEIKLQEKNNELDAFVYKASHDLKGPLASIIGVSNIARDEVHDPQAIRYFDLINKSTERLDNILTDLLDVTRINKAKLNIEPVDLKGLVEDVINSLRHQPQSREVDFRTEFQLENGFQSDKKLLTSILQNLIGNSINYQNPQANPPFVKVDIREEEDRVHFEISDNGQGIPERLQKRVFEMFYRGNTDSKGSGLGLYIVKNSIEKLQGFCTLESEAGTGTRVHFSLPTEPTINAQDA